MNYEKKYKEALERARKLYEQGTITESLCYVFPELKESNDERIELLNYLYDVHDDDEERARWIAWLEKQGEITKEWSEMKINNIQTELQEMVDLKQKTEYGEQNPADKVEPKFKVGDWVKRNDIVGVACCITQIHEPYYYLTNDNTFISFGEEDKYRLWTIQDAKAGDVLSFNDGHGNDSIELIKSITDKKIEFWFCLTNGNRYEVFDGIIPYTNLVSREGATLATKEQRDLLFQKMKEAGYEWDAEKKELKKIEQKPAWSEEDKMFVHGLIRGLAAKRDIHGHTTFSSDCIDITETINWLKSLKDRMQPKQEWSEEDERVRIALFLFVEAYGAHANYEVTQEEMLSWLKSLRPQNRWKPSESDILLLERIANGNSNPQDFQASLGGLIGQLKKLK